MQGKMPTGQHELDVLIRDVVADNIRHTNLSFDSYVARVTDYYFNHVPACERSFNFPCTGDAWENNRKAAKKLQRYFSIDTDLKIPAVLIFSLVSALDDPWRSNLVTKITETFKRSCGSGTDDSPQSAMDNLMKESNDALSAFLSLAWDGLENDSLEQLQAVRIEIVQLVDSARNVLGLIDRELDNRSPTLKPVA